MKLNGNWPSYENAIHRASRRNLWHGIHFSVGLGRAKASATDARDEE
jgi:hypothetical protein